MQIFGRGLRRRLAPMLGGDRAKIRLAYSLLFSLPGAPMLFYGEEIGMGENLAVDGRLAVRIPMQWTGYDHGGFSSAPPERFVRPILTGGEYAFERVNVGTQRADPDSLLNWMAALIRVRRECGEIGVGRWQVLDTGDEAVLGLRYTHDGSTVVVFNNLSRRRCTIPLDLDDRELMTATELFSDRRYDPITPDVRRLRLDSLGYRWLRLNGVY